MNGNVPPIPQAPVAPPQTAKPADPKEGRYKAKAVTPDATGAPHEFSRSKNGNPELLVHLFLPELQRTFVSPMYFSKDAATYSEERLRALGCTDITTLAGIDSNEVDVELKHEWYDGKWRTRVQVLSGGGVFHSNNPMQGGGKEFAAVAAANMGRPINLGGADSTSGGGTASSGTKPPF
jgi:hypothetical protein